MGNDMGQRAARRGRAKRGGGEAGARRENVRVARGGGKHFIGAKRRQTRREKVKVKGKVKGKGKGKGKVEEENENEKENDGGSG